jgi:uncharacterized membrane protein
MRGPFLPLYGSGAIVMLVVSAPVQDNILLVYFAGVIGATILEYGTGVTMEALFKVRYWDYSYKKYNIQGHICLSSSIAWGFLTILTTRYIHKPIESAILSIPMNILNNGTVFLTVLLVADFSVAFKAAIDLRDLLIKMEKAKLEMVHLQKRLDFIIALVDEAKTDFVDGIGEKVTNLKDIDLLTSIKDSEFITNLKDKELFTNIRESEILNSIEEGFEKVKVKLQLPNLRGEYLDNIKEELGELRVKYKLHRDLVKEEKENGSRYRKFVFRGNPMMISAKYTEALEELKRSFEKKKTEEPSDETK